MGHREKDSVAGVTESRLTGLVEGLEKALPEVEAHDPDAANTVAHGVKAIKDDLDEGNLGAAQRSATELWGSLLEFGVIRSLFGTKAPGQNAPPKDRGLEQTATAIETFNEIVVEIGTLPR